MAAEGVLRVRAQGVMPITLPQSIQIAPLVAPQTPVGSIWPILVLKKPLATTAFCTLECRSEDLSAPFLPLPRNAPTQNQLCFGPKAVRLNSQTTRGNVHVKAPAAPLTYLWSVSSMYAEQLGGRSCYGARGWVNHKAACCSVVWL